MHLVSKELSQVALMANFISPYGNLYLPKVIKGLQERYGFLQTPQSLKETQQTTGATFSHAHFDGHTIDQLKIYPNGLLVQSKTTVEKTEHFLNDLLSWAGKEFGIEISEFHPTYKTYDSHVVVNMEIDLLKHFQPLKEICQRIIEVLSSYGVEIQRFENSGFILHTDTYLLPGIKPSSFTIERRTGAPFDSNLYFSAAPLRTEDHISLLTKVESLFA